MDSIKEWLLEVGIKKLGPTAIRGIILGISGWLITKGSLLSQFGIISDSSAHTTTISWDKLSMALIMGLPAAGAVILKLISHQTTRAVQKAVDPIPPITPIVETPKV